MTTDDPTHRARVRTSLASAHYHLLHRTEHLPNPPAYAVAADRAAAGLIQSLIDAMDRETAELAQQNGNRT